MLAAAAAAEAPFEVIFFCHHHQTLLIKIEILALNQLLFQLMFVLTVRLLLPAMAYPT